MMTKLKHVECRRRSHSPIRGLARLAPTGTNAAAQSGGGKIETRTRDFITAVTAAAIVVVFASKLEHCEFRRFWILDFVPLLVVVTTLRMNWTGSSETERTALSVCSSVRPSSAARNLFYSFSPLRFLGSCLKSLTATHFESRADPTILRFAIQA